MDLLRQRDMLCFIIEIVKGSIICVIYDALQNQTGGFEFPFWNVLGIQDNQEDIKISFYLRMGAKM